jgi:6-phosphogluconolactonase
MRIEALADADSVARAGAAFTAEQARAAVAARGRFIMAVSGGHTPWQMLRELADQHLPWAMCTSSRSTSASRRRDTPTEPHSPARKLARALSLPPEQVHAMPVESADLESASRGYATTLQQIAGTPAVLDLAHLGLGPDGHTASLVPGDPVLDVSDVDVALTGPYQGRRRMTLTYPMLNRARRIVWLVTGVRRPRCWRVYVPAIDRFRPGESVKTRPSCWPTTMRRRASLIVHSPGPSGR